MPNPLRRVDSFLVASAEQMTPGQRWTAALCLGVAALLLLFGLPTRAILMPGLPSPSVIQGPPAQAASSLTDHPAGPGPDPSPPAAPPAAGVSGGSAISAGPGPLSPDQPATQPISTPSPALPTSGRGVVALTSGNPSGLPNRDDAAIAASFLGPSGISWVGVDAGGSPATTCAAAAKAGTIAVASQTLPRELSRCLRDRGVALLAFDEHGTGDGIFSTRRGDVATLAELARWGRRSHRLTGRVGVVADASRRADLEPAVAALRAGGVKVVAIAWASGDAMGTAAMTTQTEAFVRAGVEAVVMAAPVAVQRSWSQRASALGSRFGYVVSDVDDGVDNESYGPTFDGAVAHTSLRIHWFARDHGPTAPQRECSDRWTASATPAVLLAAEEAAVFAWCEQVAVLKAAIAGMPIPLVRVSSPLTSDVGPLPAGTWGPNGAASLVWRAACSCWREAELFTG